MALPSNYRRADGERRCGNCSFLIGIYCKRWDANVEHTYVCDAWQPAKGVKLSPRPSQPGKDRRSA